MSIKVIDNRHPKDIEFLDLNPSSFFLFNNDLWFKTNHNTAIPIYRTSGDKYVLYGSLVTPCDVEIKITK